MHAGLRLEVLTVSVIDQRVQAIDGFGPDIAAPAAVAAIGAAELDEFLPPEGDAPGSAIAGAYVDFRRVEKFHSVRRFIRAPVDEHGRVSRLCPAGPRPAASGLSGRMGSLTTRTLVRQAHYAATS